MAIAQVGVTTPVTRTQTPHRTAPTGDAGAPQDRFTPSTPSNLGTYGRMNFNGGNPGYINSPGLDHNRQVCDQNLSDRRLVSSFGKWDGASILNAQSQLDTMGTDQNSQQNRCGPSSLVAGAVMAGPQATARMAERLASVTQNPEDTQRLQQVRDRLNNGTATHGDLSALQDIAYRKYNTDGSAGMSDQELTAMQRDLAGSVKFDPVGNTTTEMGQRAVPRQGKVVEEPGRTLDRIDGLKQGESFTMGVDTTGNGQMNHWVQVGVDDRGRRYVYDPYPAGNQPNVSYPREDGTVGPYERYTEGHMGPIAPGNIQVNPIGGGTVTF